MASALTSCPNLCQSSAKTIHISLLRASFRPRQLVISYALSSLSTSHPQPKSMYIALLFCEF